MATLDEIDAQLLQLSQERDAADAIYKQRMQALRQQRDAALTQQKLDGMTDAEKEALKAALNAPAEQVINTSFVDTNAQVGNVGAN